MSELSDPFDVVCPVEELMTWLDDGERPPLAWVVRWSQGGVDPVLGAWRAARDAIWMRRLLIAYGGDRKYEDVDSYPGSCPPSLRCDRASHAYDNDLWSDEDQCPQMVDPFDWCPDCCDAIRRAVPVPPTLGELLSMWTQNGATR